MWEIEWVSGLDGWMDGDGVCKEEEEKEEKEKEEKQRAALVHLF
jgi:ribosomal protein L12E/L44/L45/RPP1/RPP2